MKIDKENFRGHSVSIQVRLSPEALDHIQELLLRRYFKDKNSLHTVGDCVREGLQMWVNAEEKKNSEPSPDEMGG